MDAEVLVVGFEAVQRPKRFRACRTDHCQHGQGISVPLNGRGGSLPWDRPNAGVRKPWSRCGFNLLLLSPSRGWDFLRVCCCLLLPVTPGRSVDPPGFTPFL